jgi:hypothetical protein
MHDGHQFLCGLLWKLFMISRFINALDIFSSARTAVHLSPLSLSPFAPAVLCIGAPSSLITADEQGADLVFEDANVAGSSRSRVPAYLGCSFNRQITLLPLNS